MTHDELQALPEWETFDTMDKVIDGKKFTVPVLRNLGAQWYEEDEPMFAIDRNGIRWKLIKVDGIQYREEHH